ncbi:MAG TPA: ABC transporter substrate-binding protein [Solirubrobacteraceae bacterium]|jgi:branched-chain amino acid transport system substrate-binding protein|nr:ABC transporter substrate-binding protein [Solirubrobacteraceae bacterium]
MRATLRRRRVTGAGAIFVLVACVAGVVGVSASAGSTKTTLTAKVAKASCPVKVLMVNNFTGAGSDNGQADLAGAKVAIKQINSAGGVLGCKIELSTIDDQSNYTQDLPQIEKATSSTHYAMVMNGDPASVSTAPFLTREKILSIAGAGGLGFAGKAEPYDFDVIYLEARAALVAADFGVKKKHFKKWALLVDNTQIGDGDIKAMKSELSKDGGKIVDIEQLPLSGVNFSAAIERAKASHPDVVFTDMFGAAGAHLKNDIQTAGWKVPQIGGFNEAATSFKGLVPLSALKNQYEVSQGALAAPSTPVRAAFIKLLKANGVKINGFLFGYVNGHDPLTLFAWAANQTHSLDSQTLANYLHSHGQTKVPNLVEGPETGYTKTCGAWNAPGGMAVMKAGYYDSDGRLPVVEFTNAPPLPKSINDC